MVLAGIMKPTVKTSHLSGKSEDYINGYVDGYKKRAVKLNVDSAMTGLLGQNK